MTGTKPFNELLDKLTAEELAEIKAAAIQLGKVSRAYDDALERMTGRRQAPPEVGFEHLTADFTEQQWTEYKRLVKQLCAERGLPDDVDNEVDTWRTDQEEQRRDLLDLEIRAEACERMTGKRPGPTYSEVCEATAGFVESEWREMERLVTEIYAARGIDDPLPFERNKAP